MKSEGNELAMASEVVDVGALLREFQRCSPWRAGTGWNRLEMNDAVRNCWWEGQTSDGRKRGTAEKAAFPWEGASDTRPYLANSLVDELVAVCVVSFFRAMLRAIGVRVDGEELAANMTRMMEWLMSTKEGRELVDEVELSAQYFLTYGICVLHPFMDQEVSLCLKRLTGDELEAAAQAGDAQAQLLLSLLTSEATEDEAVAVVQAEAGEMVRALFKKELNGATEDLLENYVVSEKRARRFVRGLVEAGEGELPLPYVTRNQPVIVALRPWDEVFFPDWCADIQKSPVWRRVWLSEVEVRAKGALEGWDAAWIEEALTRKGEGSSWGMSAQIDGVTGGNGNEGYMVLGSTATGHELIEVLYCYRECVDEDGVRSRWVTVLHPGITEMAAKHALVGYDHDELPFVAGTRERPQRNLSSSRGIPELVMTRQNELKAQKDGLVDLLSLAVMPPILEPADAMGAKFRFGPAVVNLVYPGREPRFMDMPTKGAPLALEAMARIEREVDLDFGRLSGEVPPARTQVKQQHLVSRFLAMWTRAFQQQVALVTQFFSDEAFMRITGSATGLARGRSIGKAEDFILQMDVRELDMEFVVKQYEAITKLVLPTDTGGVIDRAKLVKLQLRAINPMLARELVTDKEGASQAVYRGVQNDLMLMFAGNDPAYGEDADPTAPMKLQFAQQIIGGNPKYQQALQGDADFQGRVERYAKSLEFNVSQEQNKMVGRIGVAPRGK